MIRRVVLGGDVPGCCASVLTRAEQFLKPVSEKKRVEQAFRPA